MVNKSVVNKNGGGGDLEGVTLATGTFEGRRHLVFHRRPSTRPAATSQPQPPTYL
ncbi:hypothetical protein PGTUg99_006115 [Puccinia graminis f. sp. tritici]|uniref:Uncharacterized protein n=1 Tax=Puccinia graminis f. sp. tritici TaxID=56615 RepID=A0A5B0S0B1_PUCGR|nr:hypothetical protein PGTUg99_003552 [Puccinia graminis f. sp. tritici]KAA1130483.1 hypothetical protein PGTUg99_006115 [Puccinia graminis f. sp. tritici]